MENLQLCRPQTTALNPALPTANLISEYKRLQTPLSVWSSIRPRTYAEVITSQHLAIGMLAAQSDNWQAFTCALITTAITDYLDFINRRNTLNDKQVAQIAELILEQYPWLKTDDIVLFFRQCKTAAFGHLYDISGNVFLEWMQEYIRQRQAATDDLIEQQRKEERQHLYDEYNRLTEQEKDEIAGMAADIIQRLRKKLSS